MCVLEDNGDDNDYAAAAEEPECLFFLSFREEEPQA